MIYGDGMALYYTIVVLNPMIDDTMDHPYPLSSIALSALSAL